MKISINSGLGDAVYFLPYAFALRQKGASLTVGGNKYAPEVFNIADVTGVIFEPEHGVYSAPDDFIISRIRRHGDFNYVETHEQATGCKADFDAVRAAMQIKADGAGAGYLLCDLPRKSGLGQMTYTPNEKDFESVTAAVSGFFPSVVFVEKRETLRELFADVARCDAGVGQIGFLTALCWLFGKPFYAVRGNNETDGSFEKRKKVVML